MRTNLWLCEQKPMVVGTKTYGCENKTIFRENLWLGKQIIGCGNKSMVRTIKMLVMN
jgi:hypothetical protein